MQIALGYPEPGDERALLAGGDRRERLDALGPAVTLDMLEILQREVPKVHVSEPLLDYVQALLAHTRDSGEFVAGLSPRAGLSLIRASQAWALMAGHQGVHPEDVQAVLPSIVAHRLVCTGAEAESDPGSVLLERVALP